MKGKREKGDQEVFEKLNAQRNNQICKWINEAEDTSIETVQTDIKLQQLTYYTLLDLD